MEEAWKKRFSATVCGGGFSLFGVETKFFDCLEI